jgi:hypothetical protein
MRAALIIVAAVACSEPELPEGVQCADVVRVETDAELASALSSATDCIVLAEGSYSGPIALPPNLKLVGEASASVEISGGLPAVITANDGGAIHNVAVASAPAQGILIDAIDFTLDRTQIFDAAEAAVGIRCEDPGCLRGMITLADLEIRRARAGIVALGANVQVNDSVISDVSTMALSGGGAIYVANGGVLTIDGGDISASDYGAVADGAGTELHLIGALVHDCGAAGVWAQGLRGAPSLTIRETTVVDGNAGVGVLALDSSGVSIEGSSITGTSLRATVIGGMNVDIGDGLLLVSSSAEVSVDGSILMDNARAQAIVDSAGANVAFGANTVAGGQWEVVVQNGGIPVTVPSEDLSSAPLLPVLGEPIAVPTLGP